MILKSISKRKVILFVFLFCVFNTMVLFLYIVNNDLQNETTKIDKMTKIIKEQSAVAEIDIERNASIEKVLDIIARYNKTLTDNEKNAIAYEIYLMSQKYPNLNIDFIAATITHESAKTWDPGVVSKVGAIGLMQIMPATGSFLAAEEGIEWTTENILFDPIINIRLGCRYLSDMVYMYEKDGGLAAYNGGPKIAELWLASDRNNKILWAETRDYVPAVLKLYYEFRTEDSL